MKKIPCILSLILFFTCAAALAQTSLYRFDNGFTLSISESGESGLVGMSILVYGGTQFEEPGTRGTFRLLLDTLQRGTLNRTADEISLDISLLGDSFDMYTAGDYWAIEATVAPEDVYLLLELVHDLMQHPLLSEEELQKSKNIAVQTIRTMEDAPLHVGFDFYRSVFYPDFYSSPEDRIRNIRNVTGEQLLHIHQEYFTPGNTVMALSGALDAGEVFRTVSQTFGAVTARSAAPPRKIMKQQSNRLPPFKEKLGGITQAGIFMGMRLEGFDRSNAVIVEVANAVLDNSLGGRLYDEVREKHNLVYSISPYYSIRIEPYTWFVLATTRKRNKSRVIRETEKVLQSMKENPPSNHELRLAKNYLITQLAISYQSPQNRAHYEAERILRGEDISSFEERIEEIESVTREEILEFIDRYFPDTWTTLVVR